MKRIVLSLASLAIVLAAAACGSSAPTEPGGARFDGVIGSGTVTGGGGGEAPADTTNRGGGGTIGSGT